MCAVAAYEVELSPEHAPTGFTRHGVVHTSDELEAFVERSEVLPDVSSSFKSLRIETHGEGEGFCLYYLDADRHVVTDTWHESLEQAMRQAELEFGVEPHEWRESTVEPPASK